MLSLAFTNGYMKMKYFYSTSTSEHNWNLPCKMEFQASETSAMNILIYQFSIKMEKWNY